MKWILALLTTAVVILAVLQYQAIKELRDNAMVNAGMDDANFANHEVEISKLKNFVHLATDAFKQVGEKVKDSDEKIRSMKIEISTLKSDLKKARGDDRLDGIVLPRR